MYILLYVYNIIIAYLQFLQRALENGFGLPLNFPVTCSLVVHHLATRTVWKPTGIINKPIIISYVYYIICIYYYFVSTFGGNFKER